MKTINSIAVASMLAVIFVAPPAAAQVLGGILGNGGSSGVVGDVISNAGSAVGTTVGNVAGAVVGDSQGNGLVQQVVSGTGLNNNTGRIDLQTQGDRQIGVTGIVTVGVGSNGGVNGTLLGGGGGSAGVPLGGLIGGHNGIDVQLPGGRNGGGKGGGSGGNGGNGIGGGNGGNGLPGVDGRNGGNGANGVIGNGGRGGYGFGHDAQTAVPMQVKGSRLKTLLRILENRAWLRFAQGNKICLPAFGVASVSSWLKSGDQNTFQQLLVNYRGDIAELQKMLKRCRNGQSRMVDIGRVIGVDLRDDGQIVVMTL